MSRQPGLPVARLAAEFVVIVLGILGAFAADQWAQDRQDRVLEEEYLGRLRADVAYDRVEVTFVRDVSLTGLAALDSLRAPGFLERSSDRQLVGTTIIAGSARQIDLSRGTWEELIASGRIALIENADVRLALADYDRFVREMLGFWDYADNDFRTWVWERVPSASMGSFQQGCREEGLAAGTSLAVTQAQRVCDFDLALGGADELRGELATDRARHLMRRQTMLYGGLVDITGALLDRLDQLENVLESHTDDEAGGP